MRLTLIASHSSFTKLAYKNFLVALSVKRSSAKVTNRKELAIVPAIKNYAVLRRGTCFVMLQITKLSFKRRNYFRLLACGSYSAKKRSSTK